MTTNRITNEQSEAAVRKAVAERDAILVGVPSLQQRWIPVAEAIPAPEVFVLCWDGRQTFVEWFGSKRDAGRGVTYWMPYPPPPGATSDMHDGRRAFAQSPRQVAQRPDSAQRPYCEPCESGAQLSEQKNGGLGE